MTSPPALPVKTTALIDPAMRRVSPASMTPPKIFSPSESRRTQDFSVALTATSIGDVWPVEAVRCGEEVGGAVGLRLSVRRF
jgi:hypothetical protein